MFEDGSATGSECAADGEFLLTGEAAGEEKIGDVDAGDEQDEGDGAEEKPERLLAFAGEEVVFERLDEDAPALVAFRIGLGDVGGDGVHVGLRLLDGDAGFEAGDGEEPVEVVVDLLGFEDERHGELGLGSIVEARGEDAYHGVGLAVDAHGLADDFAIAAEVCPEFVGEDDDVIAALDAFFGQEVAAHKERTAKHFVEAGGDLSAVDVFGLILAGDVEGAAGEGVDVLEAGVFAFPVGEVSGGDAVVEGLDLRPYDDELVGLGVRHGGEESGVVHGEDGRVCADAESQGEQDG